MAHGFDRNISLLLILLLLTLVFPASHATTTIFYPVVDGNVHRISTNSTYTSIITSPGTNTGYTDTTFFAPYLIAGTFAGNFNQNYHGMMVFDTSLIANESNIDSATLYLNEATQAIGLGSFSVVIMNGTKKDYSATLATTDYLRMGIDELSARIASGSLSAGYNAFPLNPKGLQWIKKYNSTVFHIASGDNVDGSFSGVWAASQNSRVTWYSNESGQGPYLEVTYHIPGSGPIPMNATDIAALPPLSLNQINWTWNVDANTSYTSVWQDNTLLHNISSSQDVWNDLAFGTHTISLITCNAYDQCNATWSNTTATTSGSVFYYAYGDSITASITGDAFPSDGSMNYIKQMQRAHNATAVADHNMDGSGWTSNYSFSQRTTHPGNGIVPGKTFIMLGTNDRGYNWPAEVTAMNLTWEYFYYLGIGSDPYILLNPITHDTWSGHEGITYAAQYSNYTIIRSTLITNGVPADRIVNMYDAIDSIPNNGQPDEWNTTNYYDAVHPNSVGHALMAEYLWNYLNAPVAMISSSAPIAWYPDTITFTDASTDSPISWNWSFGDGTYSDLQNPPPHAWPASGMYLIELNVSNGVDYSINSTWVESQSNGFIMSNVSGVQPLPVVFTETASGNITARNWSFGDGGVSTATNPEHTYIGFGLYSVNLIISNGAYSNTTYANLTITEKTYSSFTATPSSGIMPLAVQLTDTSNNATSWHWSFGDGSTSTLQNPSHTYIGPGAYSVTLAVNGGSSVSSPFRITVAPNTYTAGASQGLSIILAALSIVGVLLIIAGIYVATAPLRSAFGSGRGGGGYGGNSGNREMQVGLVIILVGCAMLVMTYIILGPLVTMAGMI